MRPPSPLRQATDLYWVCLSCELLFLELCADEAKRAWRHGTAHQFLHCLSIFSQLKCWAFINILRGSYWSLSPITLPPFSLSPFLPPLLPFSLPSSFSLLSPFLFLPPLTTSLHLSPLTLAQSLSHSLCLSPCPTSLLPLCEYRPRLLRRCFSSTITSGLHVACRYSISVNPHLHGYWLLFDLPACHN